MVKLDIASAAIVLHAKNHRDAETRELSYDAGLRVLVARWLGVYLEHVDDRAILSVLIQILEKLNKAHELLEYDSLDYLVLGPSFRVSEEEKSPFVRYVRKVREIFCCMPVKEDNGTVLVELPEDPEHPLVPRKAQELSVQE